MYEWETYLRSQGHNLPPQWTDDYFFPMLVKKLAYLLKFQGAGQVFDPRVGTVSGFDTIMDTERFNL